LWNVGLDLDLDVVFVKRDGWMDGNEGSFHETSKGRMRRCRTLIELSARRRVSRVIYRVRKTGDEKDSMNRRVCVENYFGSNGGTRERRWSPHWRRGHGRVVKGWKWMEKRETINPW
jgi:hypothetical protein